MSNSAEHSAAEPCYHCGLPIPENADFQVCINGTEQKMCCIGCQAVAQAIVENGLEDYYRSRDALPESPREAAPAILEQLTLFDRAEFQKNFVRQLGEHEREASLLLEGITCAACIWLNEQHVSRLPGVLAVDINYATRRARVRWDESRLKLSDILTAIAAIGYRAYPYDASRTEELARKERREAMWRLWVAGFGMMQVMMYAIPVYMADGDMTADVESLMRWASLLLTLPVVFYSAAPFFRHAWRDLKLRRVGMDVPVALGVGGAFLASIWATVTASGEVYFDSVTMFIFFLLGGRYLEMNARQRAVSVTEALAKLQPGFAQRLIAYPQSREVEQVAVSDLVIGDRLLVRPGETIPADGRVVEGVSSADESLLTGESRPLPKQPGDPVTGGSINSESPLVIAVEQLGESTRLSAIVHLMERAASEKPRIVELADKVASYFVATLLAIAAAVALFWWGHDPGRALWITVSVLVVTCPCALSLATPIALTVAGGALARDGLLVTRGHAIETLARASHFVFDKTGTLTRGKMQVQAILPLASLSTQACLQRAASLEQGSEHPVAIALRHAWQAAAAGPLLVAEQAQAEAGQGIRAMIEGELWQIGRPDVLAQACHLDPADWPDAARQWLASDETVVALARMTGTGGQVMALFRLGDEIRPEAKSLIDLLRAQQKTVILLSGDAPGVAQHVARQLGIGAVIAGVTPQGKHEHVRQLQASGAVVAMVGDGVNDAPVLAQAQVSVAMGGGAQLARTQADFVLLSENLEHLRHGLQRTGLTLQIIRQNLWWSFAYNIVALPLAMTGHVTPWLAGIGMSASSLLVVLNSLRIQTRRFH